MMSKTRFSAIGTAILGISVFMAPVAEAAIPSNLEGRSDGASIGLWGRGDGADRAAPAISGGVSGGDVPVGPRTVTRYIGGCARGEVGVVPCNAAPCPDGLVLSTPASVTLQPGEAPPDVLSEWTFGSTGCYPPAAGDVEQAVISGADVLAEFRGLVVPSVAFIQPGTGRALVNMRLIVYTQAPELTWSPVILDTPVLIRARATTFAWDFGDGSAPLVTSDPGQPFPDDTVSYVYPQPGGAGVTLTTTFTGQYSIDAGSTWTPIPGTATATTPTIPIQVVEARAQLIAPS